MTDWLIASVLSMYTPRAVVRDGERYSTVSQYHSSQVSPSAKTSSVKQVQVQRVYSEWAGRIFTFEAKQ